MIILSNSTDQTLAVGESLAFDTETLHCGCTESHRKNTSSVKLRCFGVYDIHFSGNVAGPTAYTQLELTVELGGDPLPETTMISTPAIVNTEFNNVSTDTAVRSWRGDYDRVTVTNTGTTPVIVRAGAALKIHRMSC